MDPHTLQNVNKEEDGSEVCLGKADLYITEGALSVDEVDGELARLSWRLPETVSEGDESNEEQNSQGYIVEVKTESGQWREVKRCEPNETSTVVPLFPGDTNKFRLKAETVNDLESRKSTGSVRDAAKRFNQMSLTLTGTSRPTSPMAMSLHEGSATSLTSNEGEIPAWKKTLIESKRSEMKAKESRVEEERQKWAQLPDWKQKLLHGKKKSSEMISGDLSITECEEPFLESEEKPNQRDGQPGGFWGVKLRKSSQHQLPDLNEKTSTVADDGTSDDDRSNFQEAVNKVWGVTLKKKEPGLGLDTSAELEETAGVYLKPLIAETENHFEITSE